MALQLGGWTRGYKLFSIRALHVTKYLTEPETWADRVYKAWSLALREEHRPRVF
jgi:hypothetical protein